MLAGIYTHTSGHILGAPMAHYNAMNESRFTFSHDDTYTPVHGLRGILKNENVIMRLRNKNGNIFQHHKAFNYLYRPIEMEHMSVYEFYSETEFVQMSEIRKTKIEYFEYTEDHIYRDIEAVIYRQKSDAVPSFPWSFLCSTKPFESSLRSSISPGSADYTKKEEYAYNFMLLFLPFRSSEDLENDGCYQETFQKALHEGKFTDAMIQIAENIQTIHNSLASGIPENTLTAETALVETGEFKNPEEDDENYDNLLATIGELFASITNGDGLKEDSKTFDIKFGNRQIHETTLCNAELESVIKINNPDADQETLRLDSYSRNRFCSSTNNLNTLALQTTITRSQMSDDHNESEKEIVNANGTWQSISKWGENDGLDLGQQTAFEILAATYVLSFYDEARVDVTISDTYESFAKRKDGLSKLARRKPGNEDPLCMFITGPAGAGKCKLKEMNDRTFKKKNSNSTRKSKNTGKFDRILETV